MLTHCNAIHIWAVSQWIVAVKCSFAECECRLHCRIQRYIRLVSCEHFINVINGGDNSSEVWSWAREECCGILEDLVYLSNYVSCKQALTLTSRASWRSDAIFHSSPDSSNDLKLFSHFAVILSRAGRYSIAKWSISKVEFHRVATSRGIILTVHPNSRSNDFHAGSKTVVEWMILKAILRSYSQG